MKPFFSILLTFLSVSWSAAATDFKGAQPSPIGVSEQQVSQLKVKFPESMTKSSAFQVSCSPKMDGFEGWADNNTVWTYTFKAETNEDFPRLPGGAKCEITQTTDLQSSSGQVWKAGTIRYDVSIAGPNVRNVNAAYEFSGYLRESEPVLLIEFNGDIDRAAFFSSNNNYIYYVSANAPAEKMQLRPLPSDQEKKVFDYMVKNIYTALKYEDKNWALVTISQQLIPGAKVALKIQNIPSGYNSSVKSLKPYHEEFTVRREFMAEFECARISSASGSCLPKTPIQVSFNGKVKWTDVRDSFVEYIPFGSNDGKTVRAYPELSGDNSNGFLNSTIDTLSQYVPALAKFSETLVSSIQFNVKIEAQTQARVSLPGSLKDIDGRKLSNPLPEFYFYVGSMREVISMPQRVSFYDKTVQNLSIPVGIVNLHQKLTIKKSESVGSSWMPISSMKQIVSLIRAYEVRGDYRDTASYTSPMDQVGVASESTSMQLKGDMNRKTVLQFPFSEKNKAPQSGLYALEISSPSLESTKSNVEDSRYYNPPYVLAQVTDLAIHLKKGQKNTLVWVTQLSSGRPIAQAQVEIVNCLGEVVKTLNTNASGLATVESQEWASDCQNEESYSEYFRPDNFYAVAKSGDDFTFTHSSWTSPHSYALYAPGVEYFYSNLSDDSAFFHAIVGVNLVKPGQKVPVQLLAKYPFEQGFKEVAKSQLPSVIRISSNEDSDIFYELPLNWKDGSASFEWQVPSGSAAKLGGYSLEIKSPEKSYFSSVSGGSIEVAEFKIPLMSGSVSFPEANWVKPSTLPVSTIVRYANGIGAKDLPISLSYYFEPTLLNVKKLPDFVFGNGAVQLQENTPDKALPLPSGKRPATIERLTTNKDGALTYDVAQEPSLDGRKIVDVLNGAKTPQRMVVRFRYQDQMGEYQTLSAAKSIYNSPSYVGVRLVPGKSSEAQLMAVLAQTSGKLNTNINDLDVKVLRVETKIIGEELFGGLIKNTVERELKPVKWNSNCKMTDGIVSCPVTMLKAGTYAFQAGSKKFSQKAHLLFKVDSEGRVYGKDDYYYFGDDDDQRQLPLALNKKFYKSGEKVVASFPAPFKSCAALVTVERANVLSAFVDSRACEKGSVEVLAEASQAPNAFVSVYAVVGRTPSQSVKLGDLDLGRPTYRLGYANMKVDWAKFSANVTVKTDKNDYKPGEEVNVSVSVTPDQGSFENGKVTLVAIEEKILELKKNDTYKVLDALMQLRGHDVQTSTPLHHIETVTAVNNGNLVDDETERKGGDDGGDGSEKTEFKRKLFDALVSFQADVPVENGVANFKFKANDSLTKFKVIAVAMSSNQKFGTGEVGYLSNQETQSYSNAPLAGYSGDKFPIQVTIQNNGTVAHKYKAQVVATVKGADGRVIETKRLEKEVRVDSASSVAAELGLFEIHGDASSIEYVFHIYDENGNLVDSMEPTPQVIFPATPLAVRESFIVQIENDKLNQKIEKEADALVGKGEVRVALTKSLVDGALSQVKDRFSRDIFSDLFIESRFYKALLLGSKAELKAVFEVLISQTDSDGFIKYSTQSDRGNLWLTANILTMLQGETWAIKEAPESLVKKWEKAISLVLTKSVDPKYVGANDKMSWLRAQMQMSAAAFTFPLPTLQSAARAVSDTVSAQIAKDETFYGAPMNGWSSSDLADLWMMSALVGSPNRKAFDLLQGRLNFIGNAAVLDGAPMLLSGWIYTDETIETAKLLVGHAAVKLDGKSVRPLAVGLVNSSRKAWYASRSLAWVAKSLKKFAKSYEADSVTGSSVVTIAETKKHEVVNWASESSLKIVSNWPTSQATVAVSHSGQGKPWVSIEGLTAVPLKEARGQGLNVEKKVANLTRGSGFEAGDLIEVTLEIHSPGGLNHVAVSDPIPAGANIVGEAYGPYSSGEKSYRGYNLYFEYLYVGQTTLKYQYQLNNRGEFNLPPTRVEGLYMPGVYGEVPNTSMTVK